jgi:hypothetical protein
MKWHAKDENAERVARVKLDLLEMKAERFRLDSLERQREHARKALLFQIRMASRRRRPARWVTWLLAAAWTLLGIILAMIYGA